MVDDKRLSETIRAIHDSAVAEERWQKALDVSVTLQKRRARR